MTYGEGDKATTVTMNVGACMQSAAQTAMTFTSNFVHRLLAPKDPNCMLQRMSNWGMAGTGVGMTAGLAGVAAGGVGEFATVPAFGGLGGLLGSGLGGATGWYACAQNEGSTEGGGTKSVPDDVKKLYKEISRLDPGLTRKERIAKIVSMLNERGWKFGATAISDDELLLTAVRSPWAVLIGEEGQVSGGFNSYGVVLENPIELLGPVE